MVLKIDFYVTDMHIKVILNPCKFFIKNIIFFQLFQQLLSFISNKEFD